MLKILSTCDQTLHFDGTAYHFLAGKAVSLPDAVAQHFAVKPDIALGTTQPKVVRKRTVAKKIISKVKKAVGRPRKIINND